MIDLHMHTNHSDGSLTPAELVSAARGAGLRTVAITDHDTLSGWDDAPPADGLEVIRGIELSCAWEDETVHLLGYFLRGDPGRRFRDWLAGLAEQRRERNRELARRLQSLGIAVELEEAEALGRGMTGRPHFARVMIRKGFVRGYEEAFQRYFGEEGRAYVPREAPPVTIGIEQIRSSGGIPSLAHPIRVRGSNEPRFWGRLEDAGLLAVEALHSDHDDAARAYYRDLAGRIGLAVTGGSDYHGDAKPHVALGSVNLPLRDMEILRCLT